MEQGISDKPKHCWGARHLSADLETWNPFIITLLFPGWGICIFMPLWQRPFFIFEKNVLPRFSYSYMNAGLFPWNVYFLLKDPVHQFSLKPQRKSPNNDGVSCELNRDGRLFLGRGVAVDFSLNYSFRCREQHWWDSICLHGWLKPRPDEN